MAEQNNRIALITGAGTGVGRSTALALIGRGYRVTLIGRRLELLEETARASSADSNRILVIPCDIRSPTEVAHAFAACLEKFGRLDLLFNNAGIGARAVPLEELELEEWKQVVDINLTGSFLCAREAIRIMKAQSPRGGRIINNGSISAHVPRPFSAPYTATKHAMTGLTRSISLDGRDHDIVCGQIDIGNAATPMTRRMAEGVSQANGTVAAEPTMNVDSVGKAIVYMDSLPLSENVLFMTVMANRMPFVGRG